jgi:adenine-specific DNA-methyltransferase
VIKYLGSKRLLVPLLLDVVSALAPAGRVVDLFSGTSRVGHALKARGYAVSANDHNAYAATLARCYVQADAEDHLATADRILSDLSRLPGRPGYFTHTFCEQSRFFQPKNGERVDAIRDAIARMSLDPELEAVLLVSLLEAADRVDSTTGVQMAYLKQWAPRSFNDLALRVPALLPRAASGKGSAHALDALDAARTLDADICYLDPPYNQHKYLGNYHIWETLVRWDAPETYGVACKRVDCQDRGSPFNSRPQAKAALAAVIAAVRAPHLVVSFNDEGYLTEADLAEMLRPRGEVVVIRRPFKRYVGARIGIHNPEGQKVGKISHVDNHELVFVASEDTASLRRVEALARDEDTPSHTAPQPSRRPAKAVHPSIRLFE